MAIEFHSQDRARPEFCLSRVRDLVQQHYGLTGDIRRLDSYSDLNFLISSGSTPPLVVKISVQPADFLAIRCQTDAMSHLIREGFPYRIPEPVNNLRGEAISQTGSPDEPLLLRLLSYVHGVQLSEIPHCGQEVVQQWGKILGSLSQKLAAFSHPGAFRFLDWDLKNLDHFRNLTSFIADPGILKMVCYFLTQYSGVAYTGPGIRHSVVYNDGNDHNILYSLLPSGGTPCISGMIDFGDMVHTMTVAELAIGATYAMLRSSEPLNVLECITRSYHEEFPLNPQETGLLFPLICLRLCQSILFSSRASVQDPDNSYAQVSRVQAVKLMETLIETGPAKAQNHINKATGQRILFSKSLTREYLRLRKKHIPPAYSLSGERDKPLYIERGAFQYLFDHNGESFLDTVNNIAHVGHCHPLVCNAAIHQIKTLNTNTRYLHKELALLGEELSKTFPEGLDSCFWVNSGSEANELAIRLARAYTGRHAVATLRGAYHGNSWQLLQLSPYKYRGAGGFTPDPRVSLEICPPQLCSEDATPACLSGLVFAEKQPPAAVIAESIMSCAGQVDLHPEYLQTLLEEIHKLNGLFIADEVQTGFGRTGKNYWAFASKGIVPDIVTVGKPMGNGHPVAAVITRREIAETLNPGMEFFSSFGGNPVSSAIARSVMMTIEEEGLQEHALNTGNMMLQDLLNMQKEFPEIFRVSGSGFFLGIELRNEDQDKPSPHGARFIVANLFRNRILSSVDGIHGNVIKFKPPMCLSRSNAENFLSTVYKSLQHENFPHH